MSKIKIFNKAGTLLSGLATGYMEVSAFYQKPGTTYQEFDPVTLIESFNLWNVEEPPETSVILAPMDTAYPTWQENDSANTACQWKDAILAAGHEEPSAAQFLDEVVGVEIPAECAEDENSQNVITSAAIGNGVLDTRDLFEGEDWPAANLEATTLKIVASPSIDAPPPAFYTETILVLPVTSKPGEEPETYLIGDIPSDIEIKLNQITRDRAQEEERRLAIDAALATSAQNKVEG